jgi:hypothetical protein
MAATPDGGRTFNDSKSNLALTKSENSSADAELAPHVEKPPQIPGPSPFPEGGLQAWSTVLGGYVSSPYDVAGPPFSHVAFAWLLRLLRSMILFCTFGTVQSFGVYQAYYSVGSSRGLHATHRLHTLSLFSRITFRNMLRATSAGLVQCRPSYYLLEVCSPESCLMKGGSLRFPILI